MTSMNSEKAEKAEFRNVVAPNLSMLGEMMTVIPHVEVHA